MAALVPAGIAVRHADSYFAGGHWHRPAQENWIDVVSPDDETVVARVAEAREMEVDHAVAAAREAFDRGSWPHLPAAGRLAVVARLVGGLEAREAELAEAWRSQVGAPAAVAAAVTSAGSAKCRALLRNAATFPFETRVESMVSPLALIRKEPVGVTAAIAPWNAPYPLMIGKVVAALAMGCTVVMKPAPETPLEAHIIAEVAEACGLPDGVLNLVCADRAASAYLAAHPGVDKISFTGSTAVGKSIVAASADRLTRVTLELGGKSAAVVLDDFDVGLAGKILARTISALSGQICAMTSRVIVECSRHDALVSAIAQEMATIRIGRSDDPDIDMGPIAMWRQWESVQAHIAAGAQGAGRLVHGGKRPAHLDKGFFIEPTLFADVDPASALAQEEIFGPVLSVIACEDRDHAIEIANASRYGLNGSIYTHDARAAYDMACRIRAGNLGQNGLKVDLDLPFGGFKLSGVGREGGMEGLANYTETKTILLDEEI